jgi:histidinol-phosphatase (PHP family)
MEINMELYDQHLHSSFSYDSEEELENYLALNKKFVVTTEHFDTSNPVIGGSDNILDYDKYAKRVADLNRQYGNRVLKGIEIGYFDKDAARILDYLSNKDFDVKLLSVHHNGRFDYMDDEVAEMNPHEIIPEYYSLLLKAVDTIPANVLTHFEYCVRVLKIDVEAFQKIAEPFLVELFKKAIEKELAFEVNAKSIWKYGNLDLYNYAIPIYLEQGGELFSIGSDAHSVGDYANHASESVSLLKQHGAKNATIYRQGKPQVLEV